MVPKPDSYVLERMGAFGIGKMLLLRMVYQQHKLYLKHKIVYTYFAPYIRTKLLTFTPLSRRKKKSFVCVYVLLAHGVGLRNMFTKKIKAAKLFHRIRCVIARLKKSGGIWIRILSDKLTKPKRIERVFNARFE